MFIPQIEPQSAGNLQLISMSSRTVRILAAQAKPTGPQAGRYEVVAQKQVIFQKPRRRIRIAAVVA
jgi:hypothetical protein